MPVSVITGGAGGMGLATAKVVGRTHSVVLCDVRVDRLESAIQELDAEGIAATAIDCDVTDPGAVTALFEAAAGLGPIASVIHTAGVSPSMGDADYVLRTNALGTLHVNEEFYRVAGGGAAIVNVASMAAYLLPAEMLPEQHFSLAFDDEEKFVAEMMAACGVVAEAQRSSIAYPISKAFVKWYSSSQAERFNGRGLRIVSVSPGSIYTEMGRLEEQAGAGAMVEAAAVPRWGTPEEMAELLAFCASDKASYLTGTDILNDGGVIASLKQRAAQAANA